MGGIKVAENNQTVEQNQTVEGNEGTGITETQTVINDKQIEGKVFKEFKTEKEYQDAVNSILKSKLPKKEEMEAFKKWQETQKTEAQKQAEQQTEFQKALSEKESLAQENKVLKAGVSLESSDYVVFKVSKMDGDFEDNLKQFLKDNPKYLEKGQENNNELNNQNTGVENKGLNTPQESGVMAILKAKHPELYK